VDHGFQDAVSIEIALRIKEGLPTHPEWLALARENLDRWTERNRNAPSLLRCYEEWRKVLASPVSEICALLTAQTGQGQRLRQNSPFIGILPPAEVWAIKSRLRNATPAA